MTERAFGFLRINERESKPRSRGLTEIRGPYYTPVGRRYLEDVFVVALTRRVVATGLDANAERATSAQTTRPRSPSTTRGRGASPTAASSSSTRRTRAAARTPSTLETLYTKRFPDFAEADLSAYRFYLFRPRRLSSSTSATLGAATFVTARVARERRLAWERTEMYRSTA